VTDKQRAAQALRDAGFSVREIADLFGISVRGVKYLFARAH
jgi:DNA-directed RNA polymerase specialized sigma24 family protein